MLDEVVKKLASLGLPGVTLVIIIATTGLEGNVVVPIVLATLGGPFGMMGGLAVLGVISWVGEYLAKYGIEALLTAVYAERSKDEAFGGIQREINSLAISEELKPKLISNVKSKIAQRNSDLIAVVPQVREIE